MDKYNEYIKEQFNIDDKVLALVDEAEKLSQNVLRK